MGYEFDSGKVIYNQYCDNDYISIKLYITRYNRNHILCIIHEYYTNDLWYIRTHKTKKQFLKFIENKVIQNKYKYISKKILRDLRYSLSTMLVLISKYAKIIIQNSIDTSLGRCVYIID